MLRVGTSPGRLVAKRSWSSNAMSLAWLVPMLRVGTSPFRSAARSAMTSACHVPSSLVRCSPISFCIFDARPFLTRVKGTPNTRPAGMAEVSPQAAEGRLARRKVRAPKERKSPFEWTEKLGQKHSEQHRRFAMAIFGGTCHELFPSLKNFSHCPYSINNIELAERPLHLSVCCAPRKNGNKWQSYGGRKASVHQCKLAASESCL